MTFRTDAEIVALAQRAIPKLSPNRAAFLAALIPLMGLEVADPAFLAKIYRHDPPSRRLDLARKQSSCGLVREYVLEQCGLQDARIHLGADVRAVRGGVLYPVSLEIQIAREKGAWRTPDPKRRDLPFEADGVVMGCRSCRGVWSKGDFNGEHMSNTVAVEGQISGNSYTLEEIDGGAPGIHGKTRALVWCGPNGDELWAATVAPDGSYVFDAADMRPTKGRRVVGWTDAEALLS